MASDAESSGGDIPSRKEVKSKKDKAAANQVQEELDDAQDSAAEDEYVVESIAGHKFKKDGTILLHVKWVGYSPKENTWEPEENLDDNENLDKYYTEIGGRPVFAAAKTPARADSRKRKLFQAAPAETPPASGGRSRAGSKKMKESLPVITKKLDKVVRQDGKEKQGKGNRKEGSFQTPGGSWEDEVLSVETLSKKDDGLLYAYLYWRDGTRSEHVSRVANLKCPQKMIAFYEAHLQFNSPAESPPLKKTAKDTAIDTAAATSLEPSSPQVTNGAVNTEDNDEVMDEDNDDEEVEVDAVVKGVASAV